MQPMKVSSKENWNDEESQPMTNRITNLKAPIYNRYSDVTWRVALAILATIAVFVSLPRDVVIEFQKDSGFLSSAILGSDGNQMDGSGIHYDKANQNFVLDTNIPLSITNNNYFWPIKGKATTAIYYVVNHEQNGHSGAGESEQKIRIGTVTVDDLNIPPRSIGYPVTAELVSVSPKPMEVASIASQLVHDCSGCLIDSVGSVIKNMLGSGNHEENTKECTETATFYTEVVFQPSTSSNFLVKFLQGGINNEIDINKEVNVGCSLISL